MRKAVFAWAKAEAIDETVRKHRVGDGTVAWLANMVK